MKILVDTHTFLWWASGSPRLSPRALDVIADPASEILVSVATIWEIAIKASLGRIDLEGPVETYIPDRMRRHGFAPLPIQAEHATRVATLPAHHADPFDRLLVAQGIVEDIPIVSGDPLIGLYDVDVIW